MCLLLVSFMMIWSGGRRDGGLVIGGGNSSMFMRFLELVFHTEFLRLEMFRLVLCPWPDLSVFVSSLKFISGALTFLYYGL